MSAFFFVARNWPKTIPIMLWFSVRYRKSLGNIATTVILRIVLPKLLRQLAENVRDSVDMIDTLITGQA